MKAIPISPTPILPPPSTISPHSQIKISRATPSLLPSTTSQANPPVSPLTAVSSRFLPLCKDAATGPGPEDEMDEAHL